MFTWIRLPILEEDSVTTENTLRARVMRKTNLASAEWKLRAKRSILEDSCNTESYDGGLSLAVSDMQCHLKDNPRIQTKMFLCPLLRTFSSKPIENQPRKEAEGNPEEVARLARGTELSVSRGRDVERFLLVLETPANGACST